MIFEPDFTQRKYLSLCHTIQNFNYSFLTVREFLKLRDNSRLPKKCIIIRHDVDRWIHNSIKMAESEAKMGISSTYYFRYPSTFNSQTLLYIHSLGHEIGYHYENLSLNHGDEIKAMKEFEKYLSLFRALVPVDTICMHGDPLSPYDNRDLWKNVSIQKYGLIGEAYLSIPNLPYFTDTGRTWSGKLAIYDFMTEVKNDPNIISTDDLTSWIEKYSPATLYLTVHPERWAPDPFRFIASWSFDKMTNIMKRILQLYCQ